MAQRATSDPSWLNTAPFTHAFAVHIASAMGYNANDCSAHWGPVKCMRFLIKK